MNKQGFLGVKGSSAPLLNVAANCSI